MSILRVHKKAASSKEVSKLYEATLRLKDPFGVPCLFFEPRDFYNVNFSSDDADKRIKKRLNKKIRKSHSNFKEKFLW